MIKFIAYQEIDKKKWDECIEHSFNGIIYAYAWYLDIVCKHWEALVEDDYVRVFPLTSNSKYGVSYLYQPFFTQQLGVFSKLHLSSDKVQEFLLAIPPIYQLIEINLNIHNKVEAPGFKIKKNLTHEIDLINSYVHLKKEYSSNTKRNIKKAIEANVEIRKNHNPEEIINLFRKNRGKNLETFKESDYAVLKKLIYSCVYRDKASVYAAFENDQLCAGAFFVVSNKKVIFLFSAVNRAARNNGAMSLLIDSFINENSQRELTFDFEGSNDPDLARFYKSFGANECVYLHYQKNMLPLAVKSGLHVVRKMKKWF